MIDSLIEDLQWNEAVYLCALCVYNDVSKKLMILLTWGEITAIEERNLQESKRNPYAAWFCNEQYVHTQADVNSDEWFDQNQRQGAIRNEERGRCERQWLHQLPVENSTTASDRKKVKFLAVVLKPPHHLVPVCLPDLISSSSPFCNHQGMAPTSFSSSTRQGLSLLKALVPDHFSVWIVLLAENKSIPDTHSPLLPQ